MEVIMNTSILPFILQLCLEIWIFVNNYFSVVVNLMWLTQ
jgi:hypothetical protein